MSASADELSDEDNIIIPDFHDYKLELLYDGALSQEDDDLSQDDYLSQDDQSKEGYLSQDDDEDESRDFYTILDPVKPDDQDLYLQVLENLKSAVCAGGTGETDDSDLPNADRSDADNGLPYSVSSDHISQNQLIYACRLCSFVTQSEFKIKHHLKISHDKRKRPKLKKFHPEVAIDENGDCVIKVSSAIKSRILRKLLTPNIQVKGSKVYIERPQFCDPCITDMSKREVLNRPPDSGLSTNAANSSTTPTTSNSVNVPLVMVGKQSDDTITFVASERQMHLKPIAPASPGISIFKCNSCDYYSNNKHYLKQHMDIVHNSFRPYKCPFCDYAGKRSHALREHLIVHSNDRPFECRFCNATFRKKGHLTNHIKLHNNAKTLVKCPLCNDLVCESKPAVGLTGHLQSVHGTDKLYGCDLCEFIAANEPEIVEHLRDKHLKINVYKCDKCLFDTTDKSEFENHVRTHNRNVSSISPSNRSATNASIKPVWIKCTECGFTGQDSEVIRQHMLEHLKSESQNRQADGIQSTPSKVQGNLTTADSPSSRNLVQHSVILKCKECEFSSASEIDFQKHAETHIPLSVTNTQVFSVPETNNTRLEAVKLPTAISPGKRVNILPSTSVATGTDKVLVPVALKPVPLAAIQSPPRKESAQFIQITSAKSKEGMRFLPANAEVPMSHMIASSEKLQPDKPLVSKSRFTPSNFASTIIVGNNVLKTVPQKIRSQAEIGQPPLARQFIPVLQQVEQDQTNKQEHTHRVANEVTVSSSESIEQVAVSNNKSVILNYTTPNVSQIQRPSQTNPPNIVLKEIPVPRNVSLPGVPKLPPEIAQLKLDQVKMHEEIKKENSNLEQSHENRLDTLRKSLANVQELIQQQEKLQRQRGAKQTQILDSRGIPQATDMKKVVYYITPVSKQDTLKTSNSGIAHDSNAGRFRCTICGYTCEYQRTIKAHIWKHSGNKNVEYPMFQNGPLSIYEGDLYPKINPSNTEEPDESSAKIVREEVSGPVINLVPEPAPPIQNAEHEDLTVAESVESTSDKSETLPSFIVYEESKISNVAPALANLIAARTMVGLGERNKSTKSMEIESEKVDIGNVNQTEMDKLAGSPTKRGLENEDNSDTVPAKKSRLQVNDNTDRPLSVVVENIHSVSSNADFTGMQSQQGSPRGTGYKSPEHSDSGVSEMTDNSKFVDDQSISTGLFSPFPESRLVIDDGETESEGAVKYNLRRTKSQEGTDGHVEKRNQRSTSSEWSADRTSRQKEESAVTLLSLLKKGPNFNPACPPKAYKPQDTDRNSRVSSPSLEETNSTGDSDVSVKPKSGISSSLLAVIEQLRERSKSDVEDEKPAVTVQTKKASRRRSRRGSLEDNDNAGDIDNVEQFLYEGEMKYRCKLCHYNNESTVLLRQHMRLHKTKQPFECSLCDFIADSSEGLQDHMIQHCKVRLYQCKMCPSTFNYKSQLRAHMRAHNDLDILMCDLCDFETRNVSTLRLHMKTHDPPFACETCKVAFSTNHNLQVHIKEGKCQPGEEYSEIVAHKCGQCEFVAANGKELKYHKRGHKLVEQTLKKCPYCDYTAASVEQVQHHVGNIHGQNKPMKCELCGFQALSIRSLKSHMKRHVNDQRFVQQPLEQYKCNLCGYVCHHLPSLKSHMWRHAANEHYSYEFTNEIINSAIDFDGHTDAQDTTDGDVSAFRKLIHDKLKAKGIQTTKETTEKKAHAYCWVTFRCCQCGFETINKAELNVHMKAHSDVIRWTLEISQEPEEEELDKSELAVASKSIANL